MSSAIVEFGNCIACGAKITKGGNICYDCFFESVPDWDYDRCMICNEVPDIVYNEKYKGFIANCRCGNQWKAS